MEVLIPRPLAGSAWFSKPATALAEFIFQICGLAECGGNAPLAAATAAQSGLGRTHPDLGPTPYSHSGNTRILV